MLEVRRTQTRRFDSGLRRVLGPGQLAHGFLGVRRPHQRLADQHRFHADLLRVIAVTTDVTVWPIFDRERNDRWSGGRIVLLGDACHPMRPFMAAGGAMAIEDAAILSRCLAQFDEPAEAYRWYEATRIERVGETQRLSIENSWMRGKTDTDWFYCYDPCTAPLQRPS